MYNTNQGSKKRSSNPSPANTPKPNQGRRTTPKPNGGNKSCSSVERASFAKCGKKHEEKCLVEMGVCYGCGKSVHQLKDCPIRMTKGIEGTQAPANAPNSDGPKNNRFYALQ